MSPKILKIILSIIAIAAALYIAWTLLFELPYVADLAACRTNTECNDADTTWTGKAQYDGRDRRYYIYELYTKEGVVKLKDFCRVRDDGPGTCEDENGNLWSISLFETKI